MGAGRSESRNSYNGGRGTGKKNRENKWEEKLEK